MKIIVSLSGGRDSASCLGLAIDKYGAENVQAVGFEYGSTHPCELNAAKKIAEYYNVPFKIISIDPSIFEGSTCTMLEGSENKIEKNKTYKEILSEHEGKVSTYVPARNTLFSAYLLAIAESLSQKYNEDVKIMLGQHADDSGFTIGENGEEVLDSSKAAYPDAVAKGSKILMANGTLKNIENIEIGDTIYSINEHTNKFEVAKVLNVFNKGIKNVYNAAGNLWVSENHIMQIRGNKNKKFAPYSQLNNPKAHYKLPFINYELYEITNISLYNKGYLHGFIDGDGWFKKNRNDSLSISVCQKYSDVIEEIILLWQKEYNNTKEINILYKDTPYNYKMAYTYLGGKEYVEKYLEDQDIQDKNYYLGYLNGIMIAEGYCCYNKSDKSTNFGFCQSVIKNLEKCERIDRYIQELNIINIPYVGKNGTKEWRFNKGFRFPLIYGATKKEQLINKMSEKYSLNHFNSIEMVKLKDAEFKEAECFDITTTSGTFIADNVLVHNCSLEFTQAFAKVAEISSVGKVSYWTPFVKMHKWQLIETGLLLKKPVPYHLCFSCYDPIYDEKTHEWRECEECATDLDVKEAYELVLKDIEINYPEHYNRCKEELKI